MGNTAVARQQQAPPAKRMDLGAIVRGKQKAPLRVLLYGTEGIGKSSWANGAPSAVFLCGESGTDDIDCARLPEPSSWEDVKEAIRALTEDEHDHQTLVIDTLDAIEPWCWKAVCDKAGKTDIEAFGFAKGYIAALDEWRVFLAALEKMRRVRGMNVVLIAHSYIKPFKNPEGDDYDRYEMKLHLKASGLIKEWVDDVLFAHYETFAVKEDERGRAKGVSSGARVVETRRTAAWDAKNRHSLPERLPLNWDDFAAAVAAHRPADPVKLKIQIAAKLALFTDEALAAKVQAALTKAGDDAAELAKINNRIDALNAQKDVQS